MQLQDPIRGPFVIEQLHKLFWVGSAKLNRQAQHYHELFLMLTEVGGVTLTELQGDVYKEDLAYLLAQQKFKAEAMSKWNNSDNPVNVRVRR
jgi:hypothetical protein